MNPQPRLLGDEAATVGSIFADLSSEIFSNLDIWDRRPRGEIGTNSVVGTFHAPNQPILRTPGGKNEVFE
ncbi:hypothetical protein PENSUB_3309 [Penicillium subrubescens]|uniref:Uncharacterized protein n=1 Tax=Penicillium subrubescens TaxID=1316194 RepID=A0A1Q5UFN2_9EURO|nr:hypothetical protein PENSUB_3309 [Penicillium subrubescens]